MPSISPSSAALITVADARALLVEPPDNGGKQNDKLQFLINGISAVIRNYVDRQLLPENGATKLFRYDGSGLLSLAPWELRSLSSITWNSDLPTGAQRLLVAQSATSESEFRLEPRQATREGTYLRVVLPESGQFHQYIEEPWVTRRARGHEVAIAGDWGMASVPEDVKYAAVISVVNAYRNPEGFASRSMGAMTFTEVEGAAPGGSETGLALPRDARAILSPFRRRVYGG